jgi:hypothetical protein
VVQPSHSVGASGSVLRNTSANACLSASTQGMCHLSLVEFRRLWPAPLSVCSESANGQVNPSMMNAGTHTNPAARARHRPPSRPWGNDCKALLLSATQPVPEKVIVGTPNLDAAVSSSRMRQPRARCDRVVAWVIVSFLMLAFSVL